MEAHTEYVLTLANSIIGVSILAMPYCFKQCGILLAIIILLFSNLISRLSCHFLIKSAIIARRKTFEYLAYYIFGGFGKFVIEVGMIGFLIGTCIAFFVVMGDLGPEIISEITGQDATSTMRSTILLALALLCVLPLGLLKNIDSLTGVSKVTISFYFCLVVKIIIDALPHIFYGDWSSKVQFWRPAGVIQCLPIFSMALSCQTQLFEIYQVVHNPSLEKMNHVIKNAVNICTLVYFFVGFFGYIAFANKDFSGNILLSFTPSLITNIIKLGFILSIAFSFPLVIFPCRASVHSLIYRQGLTMHEGTSDYIPEGRFKGLTLIIVVVSLIIGILIPNIEFVLGLVGSSIGIMICVLFPVICFIYISQKNTNERLLAKIILVIGLVLMILGTYENVHHVVNTKSSPVITNLVNQKMELKHIDLPVKVLDKDIKNPTPKSNNLNENIKHSINQTKIESAIKLTDSPEIRHEPPQPVEPQDPPLDLANVPLENKQLKESLNLNVETKVKENYIDNQNKIAENEIEQSKQKVIIPLESNIKKDIEKNQINSIEQPKPKIQAELSEDPNNNINKIKNDDVDIEAIKKDEKETLLQENIENKDTHLEEHKILINQIQKQNEVQEELVKQQKKLIEVFEKQQEQKVNEEKLKAEIKAVKEIESIALKAIEQISGDVKQNEEIVAKLEKDVIKKVNASVSAKEIVSKNNITDNNKSQDAIKLEELKLMNNLLSAKIKLNNITQRPVHEIKNDQSQIINQDVKPQDAEVKKQDTILPKTDTHNNTAPLLVNLGQTVSNETKKNAIKDMLPLPLVVSYLQERSVLENITKEKDSDNFKNSAVTMDNVNAMRRDILGYVNSHRKR